MYYIAKNSNFRILSVILWLAFFSAITLPLSALAQATDVANTFDVAVIRPSAQAVQFERNGMTKFAYGTLTMRDVTVATCIQYAYGTPQPLIGGPPEIRDIHYDITAKTGPNITQQQVRIMLRNLLQERFKLAFHKEKKEQRVYTLIVAKGGIKMQSSAPDAEMFRENSATGMIARSISMQELADYLSDPLGAPLTDGTDLSGRYDLRIDFTPYVDIEHSDVRPDPIAVLKAALKGDLGLEMVQQKAVVDVTIVDHVEPPSAN